MIDKAMVEKMDVDDFHQSLGTFFKDIRISLCSSTGIKEDQLDDALFLMKTGIPLSKKDSDSSDLLYSDLYSLKRIIIENINISDIPDFVDDWERH